MDSHIDDRSVVLHAQRNERSWSKMTILDTFEVIGVRKIGRWLLRSAGLSRLGIEKIMMCFQEAEKVGRLRGRQKMRHKREASSGAHILRMKCGEISSGYRVVWKRSENAVGGSSSKC